MTRTLMLSVALAALAARADAQRPVAGDTTHHAATTAGHRKASAAALRARATVSEDSARAIALAQVPGSTVKSAELEREHGRLIWSFDMMVPGKPGIEEVNVDARSAAVVAHEHETPAAERKEAAKEAKEANKAAARRRARASRVGTDTTRKP